MSDLNALADNRLILNLLQQCLASEVKQNFKKSCREFEQLKKFCSDTSQPKCQVSNHLEYFLFGINLPHWLSFPEDNSVIGKINQAV